MKQKQVFHNAKWIIVCKIAQSILQLVVGMLCARYLGPSNYGLIGYASSVVAFVLPVMKLGLNATMVQELINDPDNEGKIVGTSLAMNIVSSLICMGGVALFVTVSNAGETIKILTCVLYSISIFCAALEMIQYWYQYKLLSKYSSIVMLVTYGVVSAYRIFLLATGQGVYWFALTNALDFGLIGITLLVLYRKLGGQKLSFSWKCGKEMLARSKYYILASLMVVVIQNTDHIMLTEMMGEAENGFYTAAITSASLAQFVYTAIIDSFRPMILSEKLKDPARYEQITARLYSIISYLTIAQCIVFELLAELVIGLLYGAEYSPAVAVLRVLMFYLVFSEMGAVRNVWILAEQKQKILPWINLIGAITNVVLNVVFIPIWGACGAAIASLLTQFAANFVLGFIYKPLRENNRLLLRGLNPMFFKRELLQTLRELKKE